MLIENGESKNGPLILLHAGARTYSGFGTLRDERTNSLRRAIASIWPALKNGLSAVETVAIALEKLELEPSCNAGYGAVNQSDGLARLSASIMNGQKQKFSGVMLVSHIINPSKLALELQKRDQSVLGPLGAQLLARELGIPPENPIHPAVARSWADFIENSSKPSENSGTVGVVVLDSSGAMAAGTSTGGSNINVTERISDSATVAGNYASPFAAISCTGKGEEIVDDALAARIETRVRDGMTLSKAVSACFQEAKARGRTYGSISLDSKGNWSVCCAAEAMPACVMATDFSDPLFF